MNSRWKAVTHTAFLPLLLILSLGEPQAQAQSSRSTANLCNPQVVEETVVATPKQRLAAGNIAEPSGIVGPTGFDWSDTQLGIVRSHDAEHYLFFGSDGSCHANCNTLEERDGSITRTVGSLNDPLGSEAPQESILPQSVQFRNNSVTYVGGGPLLRVPAGHPGAGNLLMVYGAARWTDLKAQTGNYSLTGLAKSTDDGLTWTDLGFIITANVRFKPGAAPSVNEYDGGAPGNLVADPDGKYFYFYFPDKVTNGGFGGSDLTFFSVARVPMDELLYAAFDSDQSMPLPSFKKYYQGKWDQPGLGGLSTSVLNPQSVAGDPFVTWSDFLKRYVVIFDDTQQISYAESADGIHWAPAQIVKPASPSAAALYAVATGKNEDPNVIGKDFYIFYTNYPTPSSTGGGWPAASIRRLEIACTN